MQSKRVITLPKSKSLPPYIGVPVEGERPIVVQAAKLAAILRTVKVTDWDVSKVGENGNARRVLTIVHRTGKCHGIFKFYDQSSGANGWRIKSQQRAWAASLAKSRSKPKLDRTQAAIAKLERAIAKLGKPKLSTHPLVPSEPEQAGNYERALESDWHAEKPARKHLARIAGAVLTHRVTTNKGYEMLRQSGYPPKFLYGNRPQPYRDAWEGKPDRYWQKLHLVCLSARPPNEHIWRESFGFGGEELKARAEQRAEYLAHKREIESLRAEIKAIQSVAILADSKR
jgi:hypothetical protein